ncbi:DUF4424 family protein [Beijerinckia mobilis]|uniref:DUF4424 family protein n=1 Tax=Beijerinckia mobilis TaxID=231434 RepID=UPI0012EBEA93|nr:DUF4424 family protein [Beijerinckia mobilis]
MKNWLKRLCGAAAVLALVSDCAVAQESLLELTHRGPNLRALEAAGLVVESIDVSIGVENSTLKYRISNPTAALVSTTLSAPLPDLDFSDPDSAWSIPDADPVNFVSLAAMIDRKPVTLSFTQTARANEKDVGVILRRAGLPLVPLDQFQNRLAALTPEAKALLERDGLIAEAGRNQAGEPLYYPHWSAKTVASRKIDLSPGQTIAIELRFRTSVGQTRDSVLREPLRSEKALAREVERLRADYCIDRSFFNGIDKIVSTAVAQLTRPAESIASGQGLPQEPQGDGKPPVSGQSDPDAAEQMAIRVFPEANVANLREKRITFDLGADVPDAPVRQFRLGVDKGKPAQIISFCATNLRKISATGFEMQASDHRPSGLLKILLIGTKD